MSNLIRMCDVIFNKVDIKRKTGAEGWKKPLDRQRRASRPGGSKGQVSPVSRANSSAQTWTPGLPWHRDARPSAWFSKPPWDAQHATRNQRLLIQLPACIPTSLVPPSDCACPRILHPTCCLRISQAGSCEGAEIKGAPVPPPRGQAFPPTAKADGCRE